MAGKTTGVATTVLGEMTTDPVGFYGTSGVAQRSASAQATLTLTTATSGGFGCSTSAAWNALTAQILEITATLTAMGMWKGGA
jgi:hypothetical protein